ncbi:MAG TPA: ribosome small subunit-dependent GTPase A [Steroidobacteraceae bacterium]|nr:ribosome small subunit-dependent GTPase A [Steroidobacteraceae bacterium]
MSAPESGRGVVLAAYGRGALVEADGQILHCSLLGRKLRPVCNDRVHWRRQPSADGPSIERIEARRNCIERIDARGRAEPVAANLDRLGIIVAPEPRPDWFLVDRYWAGALQQDMETMLIVNKCDSETAPIAEELANYRRLGLHCAEVSCRSQAGIGALHAALGAAATLFVGQSGVGKSTLVNALVPQAAAQTADIGRDKEGRHTTATARRYRLGADAAIIDAPGVRDFAPPAQFARAAQRGFVEILSESAACRFNDCRHFDEPGCAVRAAALALRISPRRYQSYRRLTRLYEALAP